MNRFSREQLFELLSNKNEQSQKDHGSQVKLTKLFLDQAKVRLYDPENVNGLHDNELLGLPPSSIMTPEDIAEQEKKEIKSKLADFSGKIDFINDAVGSMGVCAKQLSYGDVAWRCMDCEKDPTCIICSSCFEKSDHTGHRVQLKRNIGGCCDCGDPEAWDEDHFCSDHKGHSEKTGEEILSQLPPKIRESSDFVFDLVCQHIKAKSLILQNVQEEAKKQDIKPDVLRESTKKQIEELLRFVDERVQEVSAFNHTLHNYLTKIYLSGFEKPSNHKCCLRYFISTEEEQRFKAELEKLPADQRSKYCTCSPLDMIMQTNRFVNGETREIIYSLAIRMLQSYLFKQALTKAFGANYEDVHKGSIEDDHQICHLSVQVFTSAEMSFLILNDPSMINNMLEALRTNYKLLASEPRSEQYYRNSFQILIDFKYLIRPECSQFIIQNTKIIEKMIEITEILHLNESKAPRTQMVEYLQDGGPNEHYINFELHIIKVLRLYLKEVKHNDLEKNQSILKAFMEAFVNIEKRIAREGKGNHGLYFLPLHRVFSFYFTRLLFHNMRDTHHSTTSFAGKNIQQIFRLIFKTNLPKIFQKIIDLEKPIALPDESMDQKLSAGSGLDIKFNLEIVKKGQEKIDQFKKTISSKIEQLTSEPVVEHQESSLIDVDAPDVKEGVEADPNTGFVDFNSILPEDSPILKDFNQLDDLIKAILKTQVKQISFVQEISAKKWVYLGEYLEHYPNIYYGVTDRLCYQDIGMLQVLLALDNIDDSTRPDFDTNGSLAEKHQALKEYQSKQSLIDFFIFNYGVDQQLQRLFECLIKTTIGRSSFKEFGKFDPHKLRQQLISFLKFVSQLCIYETTYLKQIYNRKDENLESTSNSTNAPGVKELWMKAMAREAVHLLMLNKANVNIQDLKKAANEILEKDDVFEEKLFQVSTQGRDKKNKVTFKIKDEQIGMFDPFFYINQKDYSQIFQVYEQNQFQEKFLDQGLNDVIGDYQEHYHYVTPLNYQLIDNLARSQILTIIIPLLTNYLKTRDLPPEQEEDSEDQKSEQWVQQTGMQLAMFEQAIENAKNERDKEMAMTLKNMVMQQIQDHNKRQAEKEKQKKENSLPGSETSRLFGIDDTYLRKFVDHNVFGNCLKILTLIIQGFNRMLHPKAQYGHASALTQDDLGRFIYQLQVLDRSFLKELRTYACDLQMEIDGIDPKTATPEQRSSLKLTTSTTAQKDKAGSAKLKNILVFVLTSIHNYKPEDFQSLGELLGLLGQESAADEEMANAEGTTSKEAKPKKALEGEDKKEAMKKRQMKLLSKMKKKGTKYLDDKAGAAVEEESPAKVQQEETHQCAFCQEDLLEEEFIKRPFGNFVLASSSSLYSRAIEQTEKSQREAMKNEDLAHQAEQAQTSPSAVEEEKKDNEPKPEDKSLASFSTSKSVLEFTNMTDDQTREKESYRQSTGCSTPFLNPISGAGAMVIACKHFSHLECLRKYFIQQEQLSDVSYQKQINAFSFGEFSCPICKTLSNGIFPTVSFPEVLRKEKAADALRPIVDFYTDYFSVVIATQMGQEKGSLINKAKPQRAQILPRDLVNEAKRNFGYLMAYFEHTIFLTDIHTMSSFRGEEEKREKQLVNTLASFASLSKFLFDQQTTYFFPAPNKGEMKPYFDVLFKTIIDKALVQAQAPLASNLVNSWVKALFAACFPLLHGSLDDLESAVKSTIGTFMPLFEQQCLVTLLFKMNSGSVNENLFDNGQAAIQQAFAKAQAEEFWGDELTSIRLVGLRKVFLAVHMLRLAWSAVNMEDCNQKAKDTLQKSDLFKKVIVQTSDKAELQAIVEILSIDLSAENPFFSLPDEDDGVFFDAVEAPEEKADVTMEEMGDKPSEDKAVEKTDEKADEKAGEKAGEKEDKPEEKPEAQQQPAADAIPEEDEENIEEEVPSEGKPQALQITEESKEKEDPIPQDLVIDSAFYLKQWTKLVSYLKLRASNGKIEMPASLVLLTPYFEFNFSEIPQTYLELQTQFYKKKCSMCHQEKLDNVTCLICGETFCWFKVKNGACKGHPGQFAEEGILSYHTRVCEGGSSVFMQTSTGALILLQNGSAAKFDTPYRNKYGEVASPGDKRWNSFLIDEQGGGSDVMNQLKKQYIEGKIGNAVLQQRTNPDSQYKVYVKNAI